MGLLHACRVEENVHALDVRHLLEKLKKIVGYLVRYLGSGYMGLLLQVQIDLSCMGQVGTQSF